MPGDDRVSEKSSVAGETVAQSASRVPAPSAQTAPPPAGFLPYAKPDADVLPGSGRPSKLSPVIGTMALWIACIAVIASAAATVGVFLESTGVYSAGIGRFSADIDRSIEAMSIVAFVAILLAIALGTIGRLNHRGRKSATLGRGIGCAIPAIFLFVSLIPVGFGPRGDPAGAFVGFLLAFMAGVIFTAVADIIIGADYSVL